MPDDSQPPHHPRISIVVNCWNGAAFLREALASAVAQTYADWELVFWDDRSEDESPSIFAEFDDARFRYFLADQHTHLGQARHDAIQAAKGEWIAFLDQDDIWLPDKLARQIALVDDSDDDRLGIIYGRAIWFTEDSERDYDRRFEFRRLPQGQISKDLLRWANFIPMSASMVLRSAYFDVGGISLRYEIAVDYYLFAALATRYPALAVDAPCCRYRVHDNNMLKAHRIRSFEESIHIIEEFYAETEPALYAKRIRVYHTLIGYYRARSGEVLSGSLSIVKNGSLSYLLGKPFVKIGRNLRLAWLKLTGRAHYGTSSTGCQPALDTRQQEP